MKINNNILPNGWEVKELGKVCSKITDGTHDTPTPVESGVPFLTAIHVKENFIDFENCYFLDEEVHQEIYRRCNPENGDVLMVNIGAGVATTALVNVDYEFSLKNVALLKPNNKILSGQFLNYYQNYTKPKLTSSLLNGGAQPFLSLKQIQKLKIILPPLPEQIAIAALLSTWDTAIQKTTTLIAKKELQKKGLMQKLLSGKGKGWEEKRVSEIGTVVTGNTPNMSKKEYYGNDFCWATALDFNGVYIEKTNVKLSEQGKNVSRFVPKGTVLITCIASIGKNAIAGIEMAFNQQINGIIPNENFNSEFIYYLFENSLHKLKEVAGAGAVPIINKSNFEGIKLKFPKIEEQTQIAQILQTADQEISLLKSKAEKLKEQKKGLMQQLLTGKKRLIN